MKHLIRNVHEVRVGKVLTNYADFYITLLKKPMQSLYNNMKCFEKMVVFQSPYIHSSKSYRYSDFTFWDKTKNIFIRGEIRYSSVPNSDLNTKVLAIIRELPNYPEKELVLVLLGEGFDDETDIMYQVRDEVKTKPNIFICRTIEDFENYIKSKYN